MAVTQVKDLTRAILNKQFKGQTCIKFVLQTDTIGDDMFDESGKLFTEKDSFSLVQAEPTSTDIKIDQNGETIDTAVESGEFTVSGSIPSADPKLFSFFYPEASEAISLTTGITGDGGVKKYTEAKSYDLKPREVDVTMFIESQNKETALILTHVRMQVVLNHDSVTTSLMKLNFKGSVLQPRTDGVGAFRILS